MLTGLKRYRIFTYFLLPQSLQLILSTVTFSAIFDIQNFRIEKYDRYLHYNRNRNEMHIIKNAVSDTPR